MRSRFRISRRRFAFWVGFGLFSLSERFGAGGLDRLAAAAMRATDASPPALPEHWTAAENNTWRWYEREHLIDGQWQLTGITTPVRKSSGEPMAGATGYLDESLVPENVRQGIQDATTETSDETHFEADRGKPSASRRARHGRPPSRWLRSLNADELRVWLKTIDVPEAGVAGMTFFEHLTRDHSFDSKKITGLTEAEQARLHAAAHYGY
jgi:hypothetical protein